MRGMRLPRIVCVVALLFRALSTLNQARRSTRLAFARSRAFATSPPSANRRTSSEAQLALRAGAGVAPPLLVRAVARPRHRLRDARMCCRATHAARRVSSIIERAQYASGEQVAASADLGRQGWRKRCGWIRSSPKQSAGLFVSSNLATRLGSSENLVCVDTRFFVDKLAVRAPNRGAFDGRVAHWSRYCSAQPSAARGEAFAPRLQQHPHRAILQHTLAARAKA